MRNKVICPALSYEERPRASNNLTFAATRSWVSEYARITRYTRKASDLLLLEVA